MCEPATAMAIMGAANSGMQFIQQSQAAKAQNARYAENRVSAIAARDLKVRQNALRTFQEQEAAAEETRALSLEAIRKQATVIASAGEAMVGGHSLDALIREYDVDLLRGTQNIQQDADNITQQLAMEREGLDAEMLNRIGSIAPAAKPSPLVALAGAAGSYYSNSVAYGGDGGFVGDAARRTSSALGINWGSEAADAATS